MPLPAEWDDRVLERTYRDEFDQPMSGTVTITAMVPYVEAMSEDTAYFTRPRTVELDSNGKATITVRVADPDMRTNEYTHQVVERLTYPDQPGQDTPAPVTYTYNIRVEPGTDPLLYGALAPVAPSAGVALVDPLFQGPPGEDGADGAPGADGLPGADGADGAPGADGESAYDLWVAAGGSGTQADFLASLVGEPGPPGVGKSAYQEWLDLGNVGTEEDFLADLIDTSAFMPVKGGVVVLAPAIDRWARLTLVDDASDPSTWPNRFEVSYQGSGIPAHLVSWLNEYGELRITPAKGNTIPLRLFTRDNPVDAPVHTVDMFQICDDRTNRTVLFAVDSTGKVTAPNIGVKVVAQSSPPSDTSVIWVDTSA